MREHEMRMRVFRFLKARMRNMIMPATMGIGLAVGACKTEGLVIQDAQAHKDAVAIPIYSAVFPDSSVSTEGDVPRADSAAPRPDLLAADTADAGGGLPVDAPLYSVSFPDVAPGVEAGRGDVTEGEARKPEGKRNHIHSCT